jgi:two-component system, NtrC family, nitrogen regulation response regulator NtrX
VAKARVLIIDDDANTLASVARAFRLAGHDAVVCDNAARALEIAKSERFDLILCDVVMPGKDGIALLEELKMAGLAVPVVLVSGQATIDMAVRATRLGAADFLEKPLSTEKLLLTLENVQRVSQLENENRELRRRLGRHHLVWQSAAMRDLMAQVERVATSETRVCVRGETGTGKELIARTLHDKSPRFAGPFISLNCAAIPAELIESELFGHEKGAFTGAAARHIGKFEQAHQGTLLLDEIGDMPANMQAKLLRVLEGNEIERVGGSRPVAVDVRVVVATHRDLEVLVQNGSFREDLYHRVVVYPLVIPPLRERPEDIPPLAQHFAQQVAEQNNWKAKLFSPASLEELAAYPWPGNVRELRNVIERVLLLSSADSVDAATVRRALPHATAAPAPPSSTAAAPDPSASAAEPAGNLTSRMDAFERKTILAELRRHQNHVTNTAKALGLERSHLYKKCQHLGIDLHAIRTGPPAS